MPNEIILREPLSTQKHSDEYYEIEAKLSAVKTEKREAQKSVDAELRALDERAAFLKQQIAEKKTRAELEASYKKLEEEALSYPHPDEVWAQQKAEKKEAKKGKSKEETAQQGPEENLTVEQELEKYIPEFTKLTEGQKELVRKGIFNATYDQVKEDAASRFKEKIASSGLLGKTWANVRKNYLVAKYEKEGYDAIQTNKDSARHELFRTRGAEIARVISESGLDAYKKEGSEKTIAEYISRALTEKNPELKETLNTFNEVATDFSRVPYEWGMPDATRTQKKAFEEKKALFDTARAQMLETLKSVSGEQEAALTMSQAETLIQTQGFIASHPDAGARLREIANSSVGMKALKDAIFERGAYTATGFAARKALMGTAIGGMWALAAPVTAFGIGAWRGHDRAKDTLRMQTKLGRRGELQKGETVIGMGSIDRHLGRLASYKDRLANETSEIERMKIAEELKTRIDFMETKLSLGQINFGEKDGRFTKQYEFMRALQEAHTAYSVNASKDIIGVYEKAWEKGAQHDVQGLLSRMGGTAQQEVAKARKQFVWKQAFMSATYGALFAEAGSVIAHYTSQFGWNPTKWKFGSEHVHTTNGHEHLSGKKLSEADIKKWASQSVEQKSDATHVMHAIDQKINTFKTPDTVGHARATLDTATISKPIEAPHGADTVHAPKIIETTPTPVSMPKSGIENSLAHVSVGKGEGAGQTLLNFRKSAAFNNLPPEMQSFFKGNIWKVTESLKEFNHTTGASARIAAGSEFGVTKDGVVYLTEGKGDTMHVLGHFDHGKFVEGNPDLKLVAPQHIETPAPETTPIEQAPQVTHVTDAPQTGVDDAPNAAEYKEYMKSVEAGGYTEITSSAKIQGDADFNDYLNAYFGEHSALGVLTKTGSETREWTAIKNVSARDFLAHEVRDLQTEYGTFLLKVKDLAKIDPVGPKENDTIETYLRYLYELKAQKAVAVPAQ